MDRRNIAALAVLLLISTLLVNSHGYGWNYDYNKRHWDSYNQPHGSGYRRYPYRPYPSQPYNRYRPDGSGAYDRYNPDTSMTSYDRYRPSQPYHDTRSTRYNCREGYGYGYECYDDPYYWYPDYRRYYQRRYGDYNYDPYRDYYDWGWDRKASTSDSPKKESDS